mmetsp:Transcript_716/g.849  ORF Transcript_716/g.849 Transcript_716/m.849 type:complete len:160 (-) Transcript_716:185-664(-)
MASSSEESSQPKTALIAVGEAMLFKPTAEVLAEQIRQKEDMKDALEGKAEPGSLDVIHVVVGEKDLNRLFDADAITSYASCLKDQGGEMTIHLLCGDGNQAGEENMATVKMSFITAGLRLDQMVQGADGSFAFTGYKGRRDDESDDEDYDTDNDDKGTD